MIFLMLSGLIMKTRIGTIYRVLDHHTIMIRDNDGGKHFPFYPTSDTKLKVGDEVRFETDQLEKFARRAWLYENSN